MSKKYECTSCFYKTDKKGDYKKHLTTLKHKKNTSSKLDLTCKYCGKTYQYSSSLCKHLTKCTMNDSNILVNEQKNQIKDLQILLKETLESQTKIVNNLVNKVGNTTNNTMHINIFLNNECKNAMNLTDFIQSLSLSVDDLKYTKDNGYVKGIANIFVKNLKDLRPKERPIYCSNVEDMEFYIKDENKWQYDLQNRNLDKSIESVTQKQIQAIVDWRKSHPSWNTTESGTKEYTEMIKSVVGIGDVEKINCNMDIKKELGVNLDINNVLEKKPV